MHGTILFYGNEPMLVKTRGLILEKAGYKVFSAETFGNAMLVLMNYQIDVCVLCQSLTNEERQGISETAQALQPQVRCAVLDFSEIEWLASPTTLLTEVGKLAIRIGPE
jgi:predicted ATP-grasp superfamily ATP-dependent carboligase